MWTESVKEFAEKGNGNIIFLDGSIEGMDKSLKQLMATEVLNSKKPSK
jgi:hypothetical protein